MTILRTFLIGADPPVAHPRPARIAGWVGAAYLAYAAATYLDLKSGLPSVLCWPLGVLLGVPFGFAFTRPLLAWRLAFLTGILGGIPVQAHHRTPFSWHPALLVAQFVILVVLAYRHPVAVSACAWLSMGVLVTVSFFPADRVPLMEIVAVLMGIGWLARRVRLRSPARGGRRTPPPAPDRAGPAW